MRRDVLILMAMASVAMAQDNAAAQAAREWRQQHERAIVDEFFALLAIPNIARDHENIQRNAEAIAAHVGEARRGLEAGERRRAAIRWYLAKSSLRARPAPSSSMRTTTASRSTPRSGPPAVRAVAAR